MAPMDAVAWVLGVWVGGTVLVLGVDKARLELQVWAARRRRIVPVSEPVDLGEGHARLLAAIPQQRTGADR